MITNKRFYWYLTGVILVLAIITLSPVLIALGYLTTGLGYWEPFPEKMVKE